VKPTSREEDRTPLVADPAMLDPAAQAGDAHQSRRERFPLPRARAGRNPQYVALSVLEDGFHFP